MSFPQIPQQSEDNLRLQNLTTNQHQQSNFQSTGQQRYETNNIYETQEKLGLNSSTQHRQTPPPLLPAKLPLMRPNHGRIFCGVCRGIGLHLGIPVTLVRILMIGLTFTWGLGIALYIYLWITIPAGDPVAAAQRIDYNPNYNPLSRGNKPLYSSQTNYNTQENNEQATGLVEAFQKASKPALLALLGALLIIFASSLSSGKMRTQFILPAMLLISSIAVAWLHLGNNKNQWWTLPLSFMLMLASLASYVFPKFTLSEAWQMMILALALLVAVAIILAPSAEVLLQRLSTEQAGKEREEERADMTAHLHDGVLQTLALIQLHASDPQTVFALARGQERDLRSWLYQERTPSERSVSSGLKDIAAYIEDDYSKPIDIVTVGDALPSAQTDALLNATQQALINAVTHGEEPISVYCEANSDKVEIYVRDHGKGFNLDTIAADRLGIRQSIKGRIERKGGTVEIVSKPNWGTEVRMHMPLSAKQHTNGSNNSSIEQQAQQ